MLFWVHTCKVIVRDVYTHTHTHLWSKTITVENTYMSVSIKCLLEDSFWLTEQLLIVGEMGRSLKVKIEVGGNIFKWNVMRPTVSVPQITFSFYIIHSCTITTGRLGVSDNFQLNVKHFFQFKTASTGSFKCLIL